MKPATSRPRSSSRPDRPRDQTLSPEPISRTPLPVLIAYSDVTSARQAMTRISRVLQTSHPNCFLQPMLWRFDQLLKATWHAMALRDARQASVLALAVANEPTLGNIPEAWLASLFERAKGHHLHVLVMIGDTDPWTITLEQPAINLRVEPTRPQTMAPKRDAKMTRRRRKPTTAVAAGLSRQAAPAELLR